MTVVILFNDICFLSFSLSFSLSFPTTLPTFPRNIAQNLPPFCLLTPSKPQKSHFSTSLYPVPLSKIQIKLVFTSLFHHLLFPPKQSQFFLSQFFLVPTQIFPETMARTDRVSQTTLSTRLSQPYQHIMTLSSLSFPLFTPSLLTIRPPPPLPFQSTPYRNHHLQNTVLQSSPSPIPSYSNVLFTYHRVFTILTFPPSFFTFPPKAHYQDPPSTLPGQVQRGL